MTVFKIIRPTGISLLRYIWLVIEQEEQSLKKKSFNYRKLINCIG